MVETSSQDVEGMVADIWGTTNVYKGPGSDALEGGLMVLTDFAGAGDPGDVVATRVAGGARAPED